MVEMLSNATKFGMEFKNAIGGLEAKLRHLEDSEAIINGLLQGTAEFYGADRAFVVEGDWDSGIGVNTYEWCADGVEHQSSSLQYLEIENFPIWADAFRQNQPIIFHTVDELQDTSPLEFAFFKAYGVNSLIATPFSKRISQGYIGIDNPTKFADDPTFLFLISYAIVVELNEIKLDKSVTAATRQLSQITKQSPNDIVVKALGGLEITGPKGILTDEDLKADQCYALLAYMLLNHDRPLPLDKLYEVICPDYIADNPYNVVKNIVYRTRKQLQIVGLENLIVAKGGSYCINPEMNVNMDFDRFEQDCIALRHEQDPNRQHDLFHGAINLYRGTIFPKIEHDLWLLQKAMYYQSLYLQIVKGYIRQKLDAQDYLLVQKAALEGLNIDSHDSELNMYYIQSLCLQGNIAMAQVYLNKAKEHFSEEQLQEISTFLKP